jgi:thiamine biosynthesis lipoprotein
MTDFLDDVGAGKFLHEAMAAVFEVYIVHDDHEYSMQAAMAAFTVIDELEAELSSFVENSDISRINNLRAGHSTVVGLETFECLQLCEKINKETFGAFDITVGSLYKCWLNKDKTLRKPSDEELQLAKENTGMKLLVLDEDGLAVTVLASGLKLDLGAIGKGFALDKAAEMLAEWSISTAFVHCGGSTVLGMEKPKGTKGWPVTMSLLDDLWKKDKTTESKIEVLRTHDVHDCALSGSNLEVGSHVIEPRLSKPVEANIASWSVTKTAAWADALSTSLLVMTDDEAKEYFKKHPMDKGMVVSPDSKHSYKVKKYGQWK